MTPRTRSRNWKCSHSIIDCLIILAVFASVLTLVVFIGKKARVNGSTTDPSLIKRIGSEDGHGLVQRDERLKHAKLAIENSLTQGSGCDDGLYDDGSLYYNISRFRRSYQEMERVFRIYVYMDGYKPLIHDGPKTGIYASEGLFMASMERNNTYLVKYARMASMFYMPFSLKNMVDSMYHPDSDGRKKIQIYIANYVNALTVKYPYINRTKGSDHFYVSCHDWALDALTQERHEKLKNNAVKVVCNADTSRGFNVSRDVSLPETKVTSPSNKDQDRPNLAFFAGQLHGKVRLELLKYWQDKDPLMKIYNRMPQDLNVNLTYNQLMRTSRYCICAAGHEVNSPRLVESIMNECVPVIIADNFVLPFSDVINWNSISVTVAEKDIPDLKTILLNIPPKKYREMQSRLKHVKQHFVWNEVPRKYDVFNMIVHSLWTQRLNNLVR